MICQTFFFLFSFFFVPEKIPGWQMFIQILLVMENVPGQEEVEEIVLSSSWCFTAVTGEGQPVVRPEEWAQCGMRQCLKLDIKWSCFCKQTPADSD